MRLHTCNNASMWLQSVCKCWKRGRVTRPKFKGSRVPIHMSHNNCHSTTRYYKRCPVRWSIKALNYLVGIAFFGHHVENYIPQQSNDFLLKISPEACIQNPKPHSWFDFKILREYAQKLSTHRQLVSTRNEVFFKCNIFEKTGTTWQQMQTHMWPPS